MSNPASLLLKTQSLSHRFMCQSTKVASLAAALVERAQADGELTSCRDQAGWLHLLPPGKHNLPVKRNTRRAGKVENDSLIWVVPPWRVIPNHLAKLES